MRDFVERGTMRRAVWFPHLCPGPGCASCRFAKVYGTPDRIAGEDGPDRDTESRSIEDVLNGKDRARIDEAHRADVDDDLEEEPLEGDPD